MSPFLRRESRNVHKTDHAGAVYGLHVVTLNASPGVYVLLSLGVKTRVDVR